MTIIETVDVFFDIFFVDFSKYVLVTFGLVVLIVIFSKKIIHKKIQNKKLKPNQKVWEFFHSINASVTFAVVGTFFVFVFGEPLAISASKVPLAWGWFFFQVVALAIAHDTYFYWTHRMMHHKFIYKYIHHTHHKSRTPTPFTSYSFSVMESFVQAIFFVLIFQFLPVSATAIFLYLNILMVRSSVGHCGIELYPNWWLKSPLRFITSVTHHDMHHDKFKYNFSLHFVWWDVLCNTEAPGYVAQFNEVVKMDFIEFNKNDIVKEN